MDIANHIVREQTQLFCEAMGEPHPHFVDIDSPEQVQGLRELWAGRVRELLPPAKKKPASDSNSHP